MKKLLFAFMAIALVASASSCKKCGYCKYPNGTSDASICKNNTLGALGVDDYKQTQTDCGRNGGSWIEK